MKNAAPSDKSTLLIPLFKLLNELQPISSDFEELLTSSFKIEKVGKGVVILKEGEVCQNLWFLADGLMRSFHKIGDKEITSRIMFTNHIVISAGSFFKQSASTESIESLADCILLTLPFTVLQKVYALHPPFNYHTRLITEDYFFKQEQRLYMLRKPNAEDKYRYFLEHYSNYLQAIPLKHIASYLNIARETLSRLRNKK